MREVLEEVLKKIVPLPHERREIEEVVREIKKKIDARKPEDAETMLVGSVAKDTYLRNSLDIDFFILFPPEYSKEEAGEISISIGKEILEDWMIQYAEHPYIRGFYRGYRVDVVPCYKVKSIGEKLSAVDRTPFHTTYIKKHLREEMKNEVRLLKQFLKGIGCYGAEARVEGFSGYLTELLIIKFKTFLNVLEESKKWRGKVILSLNGMEKSNFREKFVFVDPVDPSRNVAAALSPEKLEEFMLAAKEFLERPRITFFFPNPPPEIDEKVLRKKLSNFVGICLKRPSLPDDILYPQMKKAATNMETLFREHDFKVLRKAWHSNNEIFIALQLEKIHLDEIKTHMGPPVKEEIHAETFMQKWKSNPRTVEGPFVEQGRLWVKIRREYTDAMELLKDKIEEINLGKNLNEMKEKMKICRGEEFIKFREYWNEFFCDKKSWER